MLDKFTDALVVGRRATRWTTARLVAVILGGVTQICLTARNIETGMPWFVTALGGVMIAFWSVWATRIYADLVASRQAVHQLEQIIDAGNELVDTLQDIGLPDELLNRLRGPAPTTTTDEDPAAAGPVPDTTTDDTPVKP